MGAPAGHPFFGNQYTDGGYVQGSFSYDAVARAAKTVAHAAAETSRQSIDQALKKISSAGQFKGRGPRLSLPSLIAAGTVTVITGVAVFAYMRSSTKTVDQPVVDGNDTASFGVCESCGYALAASGPAEVQYDEEGDYLICEHCSHPNRAKHPDDS